MVSLFFFSPNQGREAPFYKEMEVSLPCQFPISVSYKGKNLISLQIFWVYIIVGMGFQQDGKKKEK